VRIGIVSDVHNNSEGLRIALERMGDVDLLLCAGDVVEEYRFRNEAVALLQEREAHCVLGNHDLGLLAPSGTRAREADHVQPELLRYLAAQPTRTELAIDGKRLLMTHASPCAPGTQYVMRGSPELRRMADVEADFIIIGHTHAQLVERVGGALVINPGSVGLAVDPTNGRRHSYAVLDTRSDEVVIDDYADSASRQRVAVP